MIFIVCFFNWSVFCLAAPVTFQGKELSAILDSMDVTNRWLPGTTINWLTGKTIGYEETLATHCSSFVAAAAKKLGVYILRPPAHDLGLLANAQFHWLNRSGKKSGWVPIKSSLKAQQAANHGCLVVAAYAANPDPYRSGHIAIVRPAERTRESIMLHGPQIIQAGMENFNSGPMSEGFRHVGISLKKRQIRYFVHGTKFCQSRALLGHVG